MTPKELSFFLKIERKKSTYRKDSVMANLQGYTSGAVSNMINHYTRHDADPNQKKYHYNNQNINTEKTHLNYTLFERQDPKAFIASKIEEAETKPTKTTNVISDWIVTFPKNENLAGREREFFEKALVFLRGKVGEENIVGAYIHMDEASPHMHFCFVPLCSQVQMTNDKTQPLQWTTSDEKKNPEHKAGEVKRDSKGTIRYKRVTAMDEGGNPIVKRTISQSKMFDRKTMQEFHPELSRFMKEHFGFDVGIELEDEGDMVLSKLNHKEYAAAKTKLTKTTKQLERLEDKRDEIKQITSTEQARLERLQQTRGGAEERVEIMDTIASVCSATDDAALGKKSSLFNRIAAFCTGIVQKLGGAVGKTQSTFGKGLLITVEHNNEQRARFGRAGRAFSQNTTTHSLNLPQNQFEKTYTL